ncbi:MAG: spermidine/putrescine ABC transporter permease PotC [Desulfobacteraceae bacterium]|nr:MAG: spermidine/putrescine ABC transporter permease PotC [Desulfobacteraceae bacterium]
MMRRVKTLYVALIYLFLYLPIFVLIASSFNASKYGTRWEGWTLKWYYQIIDSPLLMHAAINTLIIAFLAATLAAVIGTLGAVSLYRWRFAGKKAFEGLLFVIMMSPDIVMAISLLALFIALGIHLGFMSLLLSHITFCLPFVVITVYSRLSGFDSALIEAARDLGAGEWHVFYRIILPLAMPAVLAGWLLSFTLSVDDVIVSFFVTGPSFEILPLRIYSMVRLGVKPEVNALATILFLIPVVFVSFSYFLLKEKKS